MHAAWKQQLIQAGARLEGDRVSDFGEPAEELNTCATSTTICDLSHLGVMRFAGDDAQTFLQSQLSNDVKRASASLGQYTSYCTPKGRMLASMLLWLDNQGYNLQLPVEILPGVLKRLSMFILRAKVKAENASDASIRIGLNGPAAEEMLQALGAVPEALLGSAHWATGTVIRLGEQRFELALNPARAAEVWQRFSQTARSVGAACWQWLEISAGVPSVWTKTQEAFVPQMANLELIGGVSFKKGCYPGQEIVARTQYLGKLKRRMYRAHVDGLTPPAPGDPVFSPDTDGQASGEVVVSAPAPSGGFDLLAVIQIASAEAGEVHLFAPDGPKLEFLPLPYSFDG